MCQLAALPSLRPSRFTLFWLVNLAALLALFLPGTPLDAAHPSLLHVGEFFLAYMGTPVAFLIDFPYVHQFDVPLSIRWSATCGAVVLGGALLGLWRSRRAITRADPASVAGFLLIGVAVISGLATGWGRAEFDAFGVATGNSSRYSIFGAYAAIGVTYLLVGAGRSPVAAARSNISPWLALVAAGTVLAIGLHTYWRGVVVYSASHAFDALLQRAYAFDSGAAQYEHFIYPDRDRARATKAQLARLRLGPYSALAGQSVQPPDRPFVSAVELMPGTTVSQQVSAHAGTLVGVAVMAVAFSKHPTDYLIGWTVDDLAATGARRLASGAFHASDVVDWHRVWLEIPMLTLPSDTRLDLRLSVAPASPPPNPAGLPLYRLDDTETAALSIDGVVQPGRTLHVTTEYIER